MRQEDLAGSRTSGVVEPLPVDAPVGPKEQPSGREDPQAEARQGITGSPSMEGPAPKKIPWNVYTESGAKLPLILDAVDSQDALLGARALGMLLTKAPLSVRPVPVVEAG